MVREHPLLHCHQASLPSQSPSVGRSSSGDGVRALVQHLPVWMRSRMRLAPNPTSWAAAACCVFRPMGAGGLLHCGRPTSEGPAWLPMVPFLESLLEIFWADLLGSSGNFCLPSSPLSAEELTALPPPPGGSLPCPWTRVEPRPRSGLLPHHPCQRLARGAGLGMQALPVRALLGDSAGKSVFLCNEQV